MAATQCCCGPGVAFNLQGYRNVNIYSVMHNMSAYDSNNVDERTNKFLVVQNQHVESE